MIKNLKNLNTIMLHGNKSGEANRDFNNILFNIIYIMRN